VDVQHAAILVECILAMILDLAAEDLELEIELE